MNTNRTEIRVRILRRRNMLINPLSALSVLIIILSKDVYFSYFI